MTDENKSLLLKQKVIDRAENISFKHHAWFVKYHLEVVEQIANELCHLYSNADVQFVNDLVWLHDYEKIINIENQYNTQLIDTKKILSEVGYSAEETEKLCKAINIYNAKDNLSSASIEIQIVSSADGASHFMGPFMTLYWYENPDQTIEELQKENNRKISVDWNKKITLPEVKKAFAGRYQYALEIAGFKPPIFLE